MSSSQIFMIRKFAFLHKLIPRGVRCATNTKFWKKMTFLTGKNKKNKPSSLKNNITWYKTSLKHNKTVSMFKMQSVTEITILNRKKSMKNVHFVSSSVTKNHKTNLNRSLGNLVLGHPWWNRQNFTTVYETDLCITL